MHDIALVHEPEAGSPGNRGADRGVVELSLRAVDGGLIALDQGRLLVYERLLRLKLLLRGERALGQFRITGEVALGVGELRVVLRQLGFGLIKDGLERTRIDLRQEVAGLNDLAFLERDLLDFTVDAASDGDRVEGLNGPETDQIDRHVRDFGLRGLNRRRGRRLLLRRLALIRALMPGVPAPSIVPAST